MAVPLSLYYSLPAHLQSVYHSDIPYISHLHSLYHPTIIYWPIDSLYITLKYSTDPLTVPISLFYNLLAHWQSLLSLYYTLLAHSVPLSLIYPLFAPWQSLYHSTIFYWSTDSPYITLLCSAGLLSVPLSLFYHFMDHWYSLYHSTILLWPTDSP